MTKYSRSIQLTNQEFQALNFIATRLQCPHTVALRAVILNAAHELAEYYAPTDAPNKKRFPGLRVKYVPGIFILGILIAIVSWLQFPDWGLSILTAAILFFVALDKALSIIANWRKVTE